MSPIDPFKVILDGPHYIPEYSALITGNSWNLKEPNQGVLDLYSTQIKALEDTIIRLRRKSNAKLAIFCIPSEILSEIFLYCVCGELTSDSLYTLNTFSFIQVCWYWKTVAYETPQLWSTWPGGCIDSWPILHARSKNAPLDIHLLRRPADPTALVPIFSHPEMLRRLRSLDFDGHASWFDQFLHYFVVHNHENVPNLKNLRINISRMGAISGYESFEHISRFISLSFPKLHTLEIFGLSVDWNTSFPSLSSITELTIINLADTNTPMLSQLFSLLRSNPRIKKLTLEDGALPKSDDSVGRTDCLELSDLRTLRLRGGLIPTVFLLEHLRLPPKLQYASIVIDAEGYSNEAIFPRITPFLHSYYLFEDREERRIDGLRLALDDLETAVLMISTTPNALVVPTLLRIPLLPMDLRIQTYLDKRSLSMEIFQFLPLNNLRDLSLERLEFTVQQCKMLFDQARRVEELSVTASSGPGAIAALELPSPLSQDKQTGKNKGKAAETPVNPKRQRGKARGGKGGKKSTASTSQDVRHTIPVDSVPLPKLEKLRLLEVIFGPVGGNKLKGIPKNRLGDLLRSRKKAGYELHELGIQTCVGFGTKQVKECGKSVRGVVWDGDDGSDPTHGCTHLHHYWDPDDLSPGEDYDDIHFPMYGRDPWDMYDSDYYDDYLAYL